MIARARTSCAKCKDPIEPGDDVKMITVKRRRKPAHKSHFREPMKSSAELPPRWESGQYDSYLRGRSAKTDGWHQARGTHPTKGRVHLGWFPTKEDAQRATRDFADEVCVDKEKCQHPHHVEARRMMEDA